MYCYLLIGLLYFENLFIKESFLRMNFLQTIDYL